MFTVYTTIVGSTVWGMNNENSDVDISTCYISNSIDVLLGKNIKKKTQDIVGNADINMIEIGHVIDLLKRGSVIDLISVYSPIVISSSVWHVKLMGVLCKNPNPLFYTAMLGELNSGIRRFKEKIPQKKRVDTIARKAMFVNEYLKRWSSLDDMRIPKMWEPVPINNDVESLEKARDALMESEGKYCWVDQRSDYAEQRQFHFSKFSSNLDEFLLDAREKKFEIDRALGKIVL